MLKNLKLTLSLAEFQVHFKYPVKSCQIYSLKRDFNISFYRRKFYPLLLRNRRTLKINKNKFCVRSSLLKKLTGSCLIFSIIKKIFFTKMLSLYVNYVKVKINNNFFWPLLENDHLFELIEQFFYYKNDIKLRTGQGEVRHRSDLIPSGFFLQNTN